MPLRYTNAKGKDYYLHRKEVVLQNGRVHPIFYFSPTITERLAFGQLPEGYRINEHPRTGLPYLRKA